MGLITPLALMLSLIVLMVAPGFALKSRVNARDDSGQATPDMLVMVLGVAGLALLVLAAVVGLGLEHGSACAGMALPFFAREVLKDYSGEVTGWTYADGEYENERDPTSGGRAIDVELSSGWRLRIGRYGALLRETRIGLDEQALRDEEQAARSSAGTVD